MFNIFALSPVSDKVILGNLYYIYIIPITIILFLSVVLLAPILMFIVLRIFKKITTKKLLIFVAVFLLLFTSLILCRYMAKKRLSDYQKGFNRLEVKFIRDVESQYSR